MKSKILTVALLLASTSLTSRADSIPSGFSRAPEWRIGAEISGAGVPQTNRFLKGSNPLDKPISASLAGDVRADFSFNPRTREGILYKGIYQGVGVGFNTFFAPSLTGTPVSAYVYQGAPFAHFGKKLWLGYEWEFGAAMGWKHYDEDVADYNTAIGTSVTAHMGISVKLHYALTERVEMSIGMSGQHFSNGNSEYPNAGVNSIGASIGIAYKLNPTKDAAVENKELEREADRHGWFYDIMAFGAWRKRIVRVGESREAELCPGKFGVLGLQFAPMYTLNRWVAIGPSLDLKWDESAELEPYWVAGSHWDNIKFERPPFGKQISAGLAAHAELTMPIFSLNAGIGFDVISPKGEKRFYQSLTLKTFVTDFLYINTGYRLGNFKDPQNLMLGIGVRLR